MDADDTEGVKLADGTVHDARHFGHQITKKPIFPATTLCASLYFFLLLYLDIFTFVIIAGGENESDGLCWGPERR